LSFSHLHFLFNATPPTDIYTLSLHDALPICMKYFERINVMFLYRSMSSPYHHHHPFRMNSFSVSIHSFYYISIGALLNIYTFIRSEEHTSELQSRFDLVCRLLLEKKKTIYKIGRYPGKDSLPPKSRLGYTSEV